MRPSKTQFKGNEKMPELWTKKDLAAFLKCSTRQVENLARTGRIPKPVYLGESSPRWSPPKVMEHLEQLARTQEGGEHNEQ